MGRIVTLTTDFGLGDSYVGTMKAVILSIAPRAEIVDISHQIAPQDILQGALVLDDAARYFPPGTIHVAVVDPGVGSARRAIAVRAPEGMFVAPDNGLLSLALERQPDVRPAPGTNARGPRVSARLPTRVAALPACYQGISIDAARVGLPQVSSTFHGRDVFAPAAARLALGVPLGRLGHRISRTTWFAMPQASRGCNGTVTGQVISVDRFGNLITNVESALVPPDGNVEVAGHTIERISRTYSDAAGLLALVGSTGRLEIAWGNGSAAERLDVGVGAPVKVIPGSRSDREEMKNNILE